ncbi:hypothetical protein ABEB36_004981 [Hypothenemus hampei]|uniref:Uncharacterized protein n=1 Tax=Hypothenemus hampei TaxID=57062 RepID=A0ABD1EWZ4_HYPHA
MTLSEPLPETSISMRNNGKIKSDSFDLSDTSVEESFEEFFKTTESSRILFNHRDFLFKKRLYDNAILDALRTLGSGTTKAPDTTTQVVSISNESSTLSGGDTTQTLNNLVDSHEASSNVATNIVDSNSTQHGNTEETKSPLADVVTEINVQEETRDGHVINRKPTEEELKIAGDGAYLRPDPNDGTNTTEVAKMEEDSEPDDSWSDDDEEPQDMETLLKDYEQMPSNNENNTDPNDGDYRKIFHTERKNFSNVQEVKIVISETEGDFFEDDDKKHLDMMKPYIKPNASEQTTSTVETTTIPSTTTTERLTTVTIPVTSPSTTTTTTPSTTTENVIYELTTFDIPEEVSIHSIDGFSDILRMIQGGFDTLDDDHHLSVSLAPPSTTTEDEFDINLKSIKRVLKLLEDIPLAEETVNNATITEPTTTTNSQDYEQEYEEVIEHSTTTEASSSTTVSLPTTILTSTSYIPPSTSTVRSTSTATEKLIVESNDAEDNSITGAFETYQSHPNIDYQAIISPSDVEAFYNAKLEDDYDDYHDFDDKFLPPIGDRKPIKYKNPMKQLWNIIRDPLLGQTNQLERRILNNTAKFRITILSKYGTSQVPSTAHINEDNKKINITWKSPDPYQNNSISLGLFETEDFFMVNEIIVHIVIGQKFVRQRKRISLSPDPTLSQNDIEKVRVIVLKDSSAIIFSNVEFLLKDGLLTASRRYDYDAQVLQIEIACTVLGFVLLLAGVLYVCVLKTRTVVTLKDEVPHDTHC